MNKFDHIAALGVLSLVMMACQSTKEKANGIMPALRVSDNQRYFEYSDSNPFFWLGDTGWLLFKKLNREQGVHYLDDRQAKGFTVIQVMLLHTLDTKNYYGDKALHNEDVSRPMLTDGHDPADSLAYDYWDHVEYLVDMAAERGLFMALVPVWGSPVSGNQVTVKQAHAYASFLAARFGSKANIIWLNGGDLRGDNHPEVWQVMGSTMDSLDHHHLMTFHPRGRTSSSEWFHESPWLDFNMFQSGHQDYDQDTSRLSHRHGPDNWRYLAVDYALHPTKPTLDGEPSYEGIPHGLHDTTQVYWHAGDIRRYAYWSVFAGGAGFTYGHNAVMQFYHKGDNEVSYGPRVNWEEALHSEGADQMKHLKALMLSVPYFERVPDQDLIANPGERYDYLAATRGKEYALVYTYTGRPLQINMGRIAGEKVQGLWYDPRNGEYREIGTFDNEGQVVFDPPGKVMEGNDWVLVLKSLTD